MKRRLFAFFLAAIMMLPILPVGSAAVAAVAPVAAAPEAVRFDHASETVSFSDGSIAIPFSSSLFGIKNANDSFVSASGKASSKSSDGAVYTTDTLLSSFQNLKTSVTANSDGSLSLVQNATVSSSGISAARFGFVIPDSFDLILPLWGGIRLSKENPNIFYGYGSFDYPFIWQMQMFIIQGENGGLLVYAEDDGSQFKNLNYAYSDGSYSLSVDTIPQAPFTGYTEFETVTWRIIPYTGGWMSGAMVYKEFADEKFNLSALDSVDPAWTDDIQLVVLTDIENNQILTNLASYVEPSQTLLHYPGWRLLQYDVGYPDYTPNNEAAERIRYAKALGFKVSLHFNMIGADTSSEEYIAGLQDDVSLNAYNGRPIIESYSAYGQQFSFAQINPASAEWRSVLIRNISEAVNDLDIDVVHLDQSVMCYNDGRGLVEGMTSLQGNVRLHEDLAAALPGIAFSGEGITELNSRCASFLQVHTYGINSATGEYSEDAFKQICPVTTAVLGEYVSMYHYPAMCTPNNEDYYLAWYRSGKLTGHIPTLMRISAAELANPTGAMSMALAEAAWYQLNLPKINTTSDWDSDTEFSFVLKNNRIYNLSATGDGPIYKPDTDSGWGLQGQNRWYYLYRSKSTGVYTRLPYVPSATAGAAWVSDRYSLAPSSFTFIGRESKGLRFHVGSDNDTALMFIAPKAGNYSLAIDMKRTNPSISEGGTDNITLTLLKNGVRIAEDTTILQNSGAFKSYSFDLEADKGDELVLLLSGTTAREGFIDPVIEYKPDTLLGDMDGDGDITVADALVALRIAARLADADENDILTGDIDGDVEITVSDALAILRCAAGLTESL